jgi:signal transduction histidine kinase
MPPSLPDLLEHLRDAALWVDADGFVLLANSRAIARTGLAPGRRLQDAEVLRAIAAVCATRKPRDVTARGVVRVPSGAAPELRCRVLPGLEPEEAFVLVGPDSAAETDQAFNRLMAVIRTDLAHPLRRTWEALGRAEDPSVAGSVLELTDSVRELAEVLDALLELADAWGNAALLADDRVELWGLLHAVWRDLQLSAGSRSIHVLFRTAAERATMVTLYGSERWLTRLFKECLESALRHGVPGSTFEVEHRQVGSRAHIVFLDSRAFAAARPGIVPAGSPSAAARDGIGLKLCQHIAALHGGQLRDEVSGERHHFVIDLPSGAPHRLERPELDIAQAQAYAQDLAALMARGRKRKS